MVAPGGFELIVASTWFGCGCVAQPVNNDIATTNVASIIFIFSLSGIDARRFANIFTGSKSFAAKDFWF